MINRWFIQLAPQERRAVLIGTLLLGGMLGYFRFWQPFVTARAQLENQVAAQQATLFRMQEAAQEVQQWRGTSRPQSISANQPALLSLIEKSTNSGLFKASKRIEPKGEQEVQVEFEEVSFTELVRWLAELYNQSQVQVTSISLERQSLPDRVRVRVTLK